MQIQEDEYKKLVQRIGKLKAKADSARNLGNLKEAESFAQKTTELLAKHKLTITDVEYTHLQKIEPVEEQEVRGPDFGVVNKRQRNPWQQELASVLAQHNSCRILATTGSNMITFVGRLSDREIAVYLFCSLVMQLHAIADEKWAEGKRLYGNMPKGWYRSWLMGATVGIGQKLDEMKWALEDEAHRTGKGHALVRLTGKAVDQYIDQMYTGNAPSMGTVLDHDAYLDGRAHGRSMNIRQGVDEGVADGQIGPGV